MRRRRKELVTQRALGYLAFVDLLGFSTRASEPEVEEVLDAYERAVFDSIEDFGISSVATSDSVVLLAPGDGDDEDELSGTSLWALCRVLSRLFFELCQHAIPFRGAVAHGAYVVRRPQNGFIVAGRPIVEAVAEEKRQAWLGITLCPSVLRRARWVAKTGALIQVHLPRSKSTQGSAHSSRESGTCLGRPLRACEKVNYVDMQFYRSRRVETSRHSTRCCQDTRSANAH